MIAVRARTGVVGLWRIQQCQASFEYGDEQEYHHIRYMFL